MTNETGTDRTLSPSEAGIFATLFAQPCPPSVSLPQGRYDAQSQLYLDATTGQPVFICPPSSDRAGLRASHRTSHQECWSGQGTNSVIDDRYDDNEDD